MSSKFGVAALAGAVVLFFGGYVLYVIALGGFFEGNLGSASNVMREPPGFLWIGMGQIAAGALLALILGWAGATSPAAGLKIGAVFGLLNGFGIGLTQYGVMNVSNLTATIVDPFVQAVLFGAAGAVVGMMLGRGAEA